MSRLCVMLALSALLAACQPSPPPIVVVPPPTPEATLVPTPAMIQVYVSGAVAQPGVYRLPLDAIGNDALKAAGGPTAEADLEQVNLAQALHNHDHFHVPRKSASPLLLAADQNVATSSRPALININTASAQELDRLPKIGPATAQQIVDYRTRHGPFKAKDEIMQVKGIGPATFDQIKDLITVGD